ncbi:hypothetical protein EBR96_02625, partial [bacterium]|nr:hypothetical protein [bacterium]
MTASPNDSNKPTKPTFWITTNSPGELSSWVAPITQLIMKKNPDSIIRIALVPCQYASGSELDVAMGIEGVYSVTSPKETISQLLSRPWIQRHPNTCVIYLGGDPLYAKLLGLKMRCPVIAYTEHNRSLGIGITQTFYKSTDGDLMAAKFA